MKVAIIGATGRAGTHLIGEALRRNHQVMAIAYTASKLPIRAGLATKDIDVAGGARLMAALAGNDIIYNTVRFLQASADQIVGAVKKTAVPRLLVVGGAGSLEVAPGVALIDTPQFPKEYSEEVSAGRDSLDALRKETELNWTFVSPSAIFEPDERTGCLRVDKDSLLVNADDKPWISMEDYAIVFLDKTEKPIHPRQRFTVGYWSAADGGTGVRANQ